MPTSIWRPIPDAASGPVGDGFGCSVGHGFGCPIRLSFRCPVRLSFRCPIRDGFGCSVRHSFRCAVRHDRVHQARFPTDRLAAHPGLGGDSEHILIVSNAPEHPVLRVSGGGDDAVPAGPGGAYSDGVVSHGVINGEDRVRVTGCVRFRIRRRVGSLRRSEMIGEVGSDGQRPGMWLRAGLVSRRSRVGRPTRLAPPRPRSAFASPLRTRSCQLIGAPLGRSEKLHWRASLHPHLVDEAGIPIETVAYMPQTAHYLCVAHLEARTLGCGDERTSDLDHLEGIERRLFTLLRVGRP